MAATKLMKFHVVPALGTTKLRGLRCIVPAMFTLSLLAGWNCLLAQPVAAKKQWVVVIDAGHGGKDPGTMGSASKEKNIALAVALKTGKYISENVENVKVIYTRTTDVFLGLDERAEVANRNKADLFISIHCNGLGDKRPSGSETWVLGQSMDEANLKVAMKENSVITFEKDYQTKYEGYDPNSVESFIIFSLMQNTFQRQSTALASGIQLQFTERVGRKDRGVKQAGFVVLWRTTMPSVLVELGFISNPEEEKFLLSESGQDYMASAIYRAFRDYKHAIDNRSGLTASLPAGKDSSASSRDTAENHGKEPAAAATAATASASSDNGVSSAGGTTQQQKADTLPASLPDAQKMSDEILYMVQIAAMPNSIAARKYEFKGIEIVTRLNAGERVKYCAGKFSNYEDALRYRRTLTLEYPDAFVVAVRKGNIIPLNEALKENKSKNK